jgi:hypothetical protein
VHLEVDVPVIAIAIAALPFVALLLAAATRMESVFFPDAYEERRRAVIGDGYGHFEERPTAAHR